MTLTNQWLQVYEQVHETVDINHPPEIRAEAAAKATVAAFAASEGHAHPRVIELPKVGGVCRGG